MEQFKIYYSNKKGSSVVEFNGQLTINNIDKITQNLKTNLKTGKTLNIITKNVESLDLTFIQLIYSIVKSVEKEGIMVSVLLEVPDELKQLLINSGFQSLVN